MWLKKIFFRCKETKCICDTANLWSFQQRFEMFDQVDELHAKGRKVGKHGLLIHISNAHFHFAEFFQHCERFPVNYNDIQFVNSFGKNVWKSELDTLLLVVNTEEQDHLLLVLCFQRTWRYVMFPIIISADHLFEEFWGSGFWEEQKKQKKRVYSVSVKHKPLCNCVLYVDSYASDHSVFHFALFFVLLERVEGTKEDSAFLLLLEGRRRVDVETWSGEFGEGGEQESLSWRRDLSVFNVNEKIDQIAQPRKRFYCFVSDELRREQCESM